MQGADVEPHVLPSASQSAATPPPNASPPASTDMQGLFLRLDQNTQAMLALVEAIRALIEYGTEQNPEDDDSLGVSVGLDGLPIRRS